MAEQFFIIKVTGLKDGQRFYPDYLNQVVERYVNLTLPDVEIEITEEMRSRDIREEVSDHLVAIIEHDRFVSPSERSLLESAVCIIEAAMQRESKEILQTPLMDLVIPIRQVQHGTQ